MIYFKKGFGFIFKHRIKFLIFLFLSIYVLKNIILDPDRATYSQAMTLKNSIQDIMIDSKSEDFILLDANVTFTKTYIFMKPLGDKKYSKAFYLNVDVDKNKNQDLLLYFVLNIRQYDSIVRSTQGKCNKIKFTDQYKNSSIFRFYDKSEITYKSIFDFSETSNGVMEISFGNESCGDIYQVSISGFFKNVRSPEKIKLRASIK